MGKVHEGNEGRARKTSSGNYEKKRKRKRKERGIFLVSRVTGV